MRYPSIFAIAIAVALAPLAARAEVDPPPGLLDRDVAIERFFLELAGNTHGFTNDEEWHLAGTVYDAAQAHDVDPFLVLAVIRVESTFKRGQRSSVGALGLMQVRPGTARAMARVAGVHWRGRHTLLHPADNIRLGTAYLARLLHRFHGNATLALTAYCHGPTEVRRMIRGHRLDKSALRYARKVTAFWHRYREGLTSKRPVS